jgi:ribosomal protein S18 acetylase RimI-like enzyme
MPVRIEPADLDSHDHQHQLFTLLDYYSRDAMGNRAPLPATIARDLVAGLRRHPASLVLLAWHAERCVGLAICFEGFSTFQARPLLNIHDFVIHPEFRNRGIGRALLSAVEAAARERNCCKITLEVRADNSVAQHLYRAFGFSESEPAMHFWHKTLQPGG